MIRFFYSFNKFGHTNVRCGQCWAGADFCWAGAGSYWAGAVKEAVCLIQGQQVALIDQKSRISTILENMSRTDRQTDTETDGRTYPLIEMLAASKKADGIGPCIKSIKIYKVKTSIIWMLKNRLGMQNISCVEDRPLYLDVHQRDQLLLLLLLWLLLLSLLTS